MPILSAILLQYFRLSSFYLKFLFHKSCKHYLSRGILCSFVLLRSPHYLTIQSVNPVPLIVIRSANWVYCTYLVKVASRLTIFLQILIGAFLQNRSGGFSVRPSQPLHTIHTVYSLLFYCIFMLETSCNKQSLGSGKWLWSFTLTRTKRRRPRKGSRRLARPMKSSGKCRLCSEKLPDLRGLSGKVWFWMTERVL